MTFSPHWHREVDEIVQVAIHYAIEVRNPSQAALRALAAIERIVSDDFCNDLEMRTLPSESHPLTGDLKICEEKIGKIYCIAHAEIPSHCCYPVHDDWRKLKDEVLAHCKP